MRCRAITYDKTELRKRLESTTEFSHFVTNCGSFVQHIKFVQNKIFYILYPEQFCTQSNIE